MPAASSSDGGLPLAGRLTAQWRTKAALALILGPAFLTGYFLLEHFPLRPVHTLPLTWVDRAVGFHPGWVWVYQSIYLPINLLPWLAVSRLQLRRFVRGFALLVGVSFLIFLAYPVAGPRPPAVGAHGMYGLLLRYDGPLNAFPSLHAGLMVYALAFAWRVAGRQAPVIVASAALWSLLVLYSTIAIKEHYAADVWAGIVMACVCDWYAWRTRSGLDALPGHAKNIEQQPVGVPLGR